MTEKADLCASIAATIATYRQGEIVLPTAAHVERWVGQFTVANELPFLREFDHVMKETFITEATVQAYLTNLAKNNDLAGSDPSSYWASANFLQIQKAGQSQKKMLKIFAECLTTQYGLNLDQCGKEGGDYIYLDDVLFTGGRVASDLNAWMENIAPVGCTVHVILMAMHTSGHFYITTKRLADAVAKKKITLKFWRSVELENRLYYKYGSDVLWPTAIPTEPTIHTYVASLGADKVQLRAPPGGRNKVFSSEEGRQILEQEFLVAGAKIRAMSNPKDFYRPLGCGNFGVGFGSTIVTYRNCPNNCPLAMWWGDGSTQAGALSWYPLLPRKTYASFENIFGGL